MLSPRRAQNLGKIRRRACLRLIPFPGTGDVLLAPTMISHPLAYVAPTTRQKSSKSSSHKKSSSKKARAFIGKEMDSEAESEENEEDEASEDSESGVASLALATAFVSKSIFNTEDNDLTNKADEGNDDYTHGKGCQGTQIYLL